MSSESTPNPRNNHANRQSGSSGVYNANPNRSKFFRDLPYSFNTSDLRHLCESEGLEVEEAHVGLNGSKKTLQYGYVLFRSEADAQRAREILHNRRVLGRDIRVCEFNRESNGESSKDGKVMVSFKCSQSFSSLITEQIVRDIFEKKFNHPLASVSIRKHQKTNNGGQAGFGFISFGDEALDNQVVSTVKKVEMDGISFDCTRSNADQSPDLSQANAASQSATGGASPRANDAPSNGASPTTNESYSEFPSEGVGKSPRANIVQSTRTVGKSSLATGVSVHDAHNLRPSRRSNGTSIRNRTSGITDRLREEEAAANNAQSSKNRHNNKIHAEEDSFPSFQVVPPSSSGTTSHAQLQQQQQMNQPHHYVTNWSIHQSPPTPITTYNIPIPMSQPLAVGIPNSSSTTLGQAYTSPTMYYAVTSPNLRYTTYMGSPAGYTLAPATQTTPQPLPMPIQPPAPQSYSPRFAHHNPHHMHHQQAQHIYVAVPQAPPHSENVTVATTNSNSNSNNNNAINSKIEYMTSETQLRYSQQMTAPQQQQQLQTRHRTFSADDNSPTPVGTYYLSPSDSTTYHDCASFSDIYTNANGGTVVGGAPSAPSQGSSTGVSTANPASFHPTPPLSYAPQPVQQQASYHPGHMQPQQVIHPHHHMHPTQQHVPHHQYPLSNVPVQTTAYATPVGTYSFHPN